MLVYSLYKGFGPTRKSFGPKFSVPKILLSKFFLPKYFSSPFLLDNNTFFYPNFFCQVVQLGLKLNTKPALNHPSPPPPTRNFSKGSRHNRGLRFGIKAKEVISTPIKHLALSRREGGARNLIRRLKIFLVLYSKPTKSTKLPI